MSKERFGLRILVCACSVTYMGYTVAHVHATQTEIREDASVFRTTKDSESPTERNQTGPSLRADKPVVLTGSARQSKSRQRQIKGAGSDSKQIGRKGHRKGRMSKKKTRKALMEPRRELIPHGMIEGPRRYDPRPNYRTAGVRDPQTRDLIHDHFQELDRNKDGRIDPVERAFGRLDMDRDLSSRQLQ